MGADLECLTILAGWVEGCQGQPTYHSGRLVQAALAAQTCPAAFPSIRPTPTRLLPLPSHSWLEDAASEASEVGLMSSLLKLLRNMPLDAALLDKSGGWAGTCIMHRGVGFGLRACA